MTVVEHERITLDPYKRGGKLCIRGLRITVYDVLSQLAEGVSHAEILDEFPELEEQDILACLAFSADREHRVLRSQVTDEREYKVSGKK